MATTIVKGSQPLDYGNFGPFASHTISLPSSLFERTLSWLGPEGLWTAEVVCRNWRKYIHATDQWKIQCQYMLGLSSGIDPKKYLSESLSYKENARMVFSSILGESVWRRYIGEVGLVPQIPEAISLKMWNEQDPCDPRTTIGKEYVWLFCPSHIVTALKGFSLSGPDDSTNPEAPKLVEKTGSNVLKTPVTINNIGKVFKNLKTGHPSMYSYIWSDIVEQHGNKRNQSEWVCMRRSMIGRNLSFAMQQQLVKRNKVGIAQLLHRIVFNFLEHARTNDYPDGKIWSDVARTSTLTRGEQGADWPSGCGNGGSTGLEVLHDRIRDSSNVGAAVVLLGESPGIMPFIKNNV